jgi:uncharacterized membrane protein YhaH (DUF805 family)
MNFSESISTCFSKYADFTGTAKRSEFWWFSLFTTVVSIILDKTSPVAYAIFALATIVPSVAVACRRLHDTDRSGWWQLLLFVPFIGWIVLLVFYVQEGRPNRYGKPVIDLEKQPQ